MLGAMSEGARRDLGGSAPVDDLTDEERAELERETHLRRGDEVLWIEPDGRFRREPLSKVYYLHTPRGIFRLSRITKQVVEV